MIMTTPLVCADLFCGAGGTSTGLVRASRARGIHLDLLAINHWRVAVDTHIRNHPWARHLCADLSSVDPNKAIPGGTLDLLIASPECTHHSIARGGKPCSDQSRASAWHVLHWAERLRIDHILIENVQEFQQWGPLGMDNRPIKSRKGETFRAFLAALRSMGFDVEHRILNAADYGDATSRRRLFIQAARDGKRITWPRPTHAGRWRPAREIIDWTLKGESIRNRKRPLAPKTLDRIEAGLKKFGGQAFIAVLRGTDEQRQGGSWARSLDKPLPTISAGGIHAAICEPFVLGQHSGGAPRAVSQPIPTICTESRGIALVQPFLVPMYGERPNQVPRTHDINDPVPTIPASGGGKFGLCEPFIVQYQGGNGSKALRTHSVDAPLPTQPTENRFGLCQPYLVKYYGKSDARPISEPLGTITSLDRFALVEPTRMDIYFRMLQPHELAAAMGFDGYEFAGTKTDQVRQIGNAVAVKTAQALCGAIIDQR